MGALDRPGGRLALALLVAVLATPSVAAQGPDTGPDVEVEDAEIEDIVVPLDEPGETSLTVRVGCEAQEAPDTTTSVELRPMSVPRWANVIVSPSSFSFRTAPGDCPSTEMPFERDTTIRVSLDQDAPAYEQTTLTIGANVTKEPPGDLDGRGYGPYEGAVSLTPGYFHLHNVLADEKIQEARPGQQVSYEATIANYANHETLYEVSLAEAVPDGHTVTYDPTELVLAPNETGTFTIEVRSDKGAIDTSTVSVETLIEGRSTHELGGETGTSRISVLAKYTPPVPDPRDAMPVPAPGVAAALAATLVAVWRLGREGRA